MRMEPRIVIVVYRPHAGKEAALEKLVARHLSVLRTEGLVTARVPVLMKAADGSIVEIFEWLSREAIETAHSNHRVQKLWEEFGKVCTYEKPVNVAEFQNLFSEFEPI